MRDERTKEVSEFKSFRPLLGIRFFDYKTKVFKELSKVSVPYWGLDFLIIAIVEESKPYRFPSPIGD